MPSPPLLDFQDVAKRLGCSDRTVWAMAKRGELPVVRLPGRLVRVDPIDLDEFIQRCKVARREGSNGD